MRGSGDDKVLIVDAAPVVRSLLRNALTARFPRIEVHEADTLQSGYRSARGVTPGLVLLEVRLPDGNGLDLARRLNSEMPEVALCICTAQDDLEYRRAAREAGARHFISKLEWRSETLERLVRETFPGTAARSRNRRRRAGDRGG